MIFDQMVTPPVTVTDTTTDTTGTTMVAWVLQFVRYCLSISRRMYRPPPMCAPNRGTHKSVAHPTVDDACNSVTHWE
jgi:hypothetical protein